MQSKVRSCLLTISGDKKSVSEANTASHSSKIFMLTSLDRNAFAVLKLFPVYRSCCRTDSYSDSKTPTTTSITAWHTDMSISLNSLDSIHSVRSFLSEVLVEIP